ncbi:hypothetical protein D910_08208 [Dendroctonus ponderosae]|uniref:Uncharacterized protein n=1 Tax=Dendroctonus ponderosae TaxID=77166 RepID=U4UEX7_DENPD|nr:hypothetical protein D910_08208 [Dendroctonus ponderosae]
MDGIIEENIYADSIIYEDKKHGEKPPKVPVPKDKYLICHIVFFLIGVSHFLPISFLASANNFWLYKFRDPLDENTSAENRTTLQTYFASATLIANTVPAFIFGLFNIIGGHKFKITSRLLLTLGIELMVFTLITISATINTDNPNYFSPVMTFFLSDVCMLAGRLMASAITIDIPEGPFLLVSIVRTLVLVPLIWLCNAQPRNHLPVLFPHDYQYGIILATFMLTSGLILNMSILVVPKKVSKEDADVAYTLIGLIINTLQALTSPIGLVIVNVL